MPSGVPGSAQVDSGVHYSKFAAVVKAAEGLEGEDSGSEASWLRDGLELPEPSNEEQVEGAPQEEPPENNPSQEAVKEPGDDDDPWEDKHNVAAMSDEEFDELVCKGAFTGANKVLRFVVPIKSRHGAHILAGLQEVVTECHRSGYPVQVVHTDRAKDLMSKGIMDWLQSQLIQPSFTQGDDPKSNGLAERLVGWVKARARLHLASSGMGLKNGLQLWSLLVLNTDIGCCAEKVVWEHGVYLHPTTRTEGGHLLLRAASNAFLVAKNVRTTEELFDPETELGADMLEAELEDSLPSKDAPKVPERRITGKRAVKAVQLASEALAEELLRDQACSADDCGRLLSMAFEGVTGGTKREHRGASEFLNGARFLLPWRY
ncbi:TY5A [Symbiodinium sp. CCMP2592]|nr:TY5A [Symbiodinium sp. CCMP2592]